mmetsp:Transcript_13266/g.29226  ORF Transcript_13266/g.29226 Transcript_13266/m.29226 type:complete len:228 (-) Transcript_13266:1354-2037(-)
MSRRRTGAPGTGPFPLLCRGLSRRYRPHPLPLPRTGPGAALLPPPPRPAVQRGPGPPPLRTRTGLPGPLHRPRKRVGRAIRPRSRHRGHGGALGAIPGSQTGVHGPRRGGRESVHGAAFVAALDLSLRRGGEDRHRASELHPPGPRLRFSERGDPGGHRGHGGGDPEDRDGGASQRGGLQPDLRPSSLYPARGLSLRRKYRAGGERGQRPRHPRQGKFRLRRVRKTG